MDYILHRPKRKMRNNIILLLQFIIYKIYNIKILQI